MHFLCEELSQQEMPETKDKISDVKEKKKIKISTE
jgi:hypothetical protein